MTTIPAELLTIKTRFDEWGTGRKFKREPIPNDLRQAVVKISNQISRAQIRKILKVDPWRLMEQKTKMSPSRNAVWRWQALPFMTWLKSITMLRISLIRRNCAESARSISILTSTSIHAGAGGY